MVGYVPVCHHMAHQYCSYKKILVHYVCALIIVVSTVRRGSMYSPYHVLLTCSIGWVRQPYSAPSTLAMHTIRFAYARAVSLKLLFSHRRGCMSILSSPLGYAMRLPLFSGCWTFSDLTHCMTIYLDNILVFSPTIEQCMLDLRAVFEKLCAEKLFAKR